MYIKSKKTTINVLICMLTVLLSLTCFISLKRSSVVKADATVSAPQELRVDNTGYLRWKAASGATGYQWSYSTNGGSSYSDPITCVGEEADISDAINESIVAAQSGSKESLDLKFKVKSLPDGGESTVDYCSSRVEGYYRPADSKKLYVDLGYTQHDITERVGITGIPFFCK